jgi:hypothetical protein
MKQPVGIRSTSRQRVKVLKDKKSQKKREEVITLLRIKLPKKGKRTL